jgi:hypothetical protein
MMSQLRDRGGFMNDKPVIETPVSELLVVVRALAKRAARPDHYREARKRGRPFKRILKARVGSGSKTAK